MPRFDLPSGNWVEYRASLKAGDKTQTQNAVTFTVEDGKMSQPGGTTMTVRNALLARIITNWSYAEAEHGGIPIPSQHVAGAGIIDDTIDIDDYNALAQEIDPLLQKVGWGAPNSPKPTAAS